MAKRTFLVTGASKGIGRALSDRLVRGGHHVVGLARNRGDFPGELVPVDLADRDETAAVLEDLVGRYSFGGVVNNVGLVRPQLLGEIRLADLDDVLSLNLHSRSMQASWKPTPAVITARHRTRSIGRHPSAKRVRLLSSSQVSTMRFPMQIASCRR